MGTAVLPTHAPLLSGHSALVLLCRVVRWVWDSMVGFSLRSGQPIDATHSATMTSSGLGRVGQISVHPRTFAKPLEKKVFITGIVEKKGSVPKATGSHLAATKQEHN